MVVLIPGRWQPFHEGHKSLIQAVLDEGNEVIVGIRTTDKDENNPFTIEERIKMISDAMGNRVTIEVLPRFDEIVYGRKVGYGIREVRLNKEIEAISATNARKSL